MSAEGDGPTYPCYWVYKDNLYEWRWVYYGEGGEALAVSSEGYRNKFDCLRSIEMVRTSNRARLYAPKGL
jgi:uncharacterized protein